MIGFMEAQALKNMFNLTDADIALLQARIPDLVYMVKLAMSNQTVANRVIRDLGPIVVKILTREGMLKQ